MGLRGLLTLFPPKVSGSTPLDLEPVHTGFLLEGLVTNDYGGARELAGHLAY